MPVNEVNRIFRGFFSTDAVRLGSLHPTEIRRRIHKKDH
jgi:hypothetical protein